MMSEVINFGCRLNLYESEVIKDLLKDQNAAENLVVINSCAVTKEAERQVRQTIRKIHKSSPEKKIIVTGCGAQVNPQSFAKMPEVAKIIGNEEKMKKESYFVDKFSENSERILVNDIMSVKHTASHLVSSFEGKIRGYLQIQNGCDHSCTFCTIPNGRGKNRSVALGEIVNQAKLLTEANYQEIILTGVDITDYGKDLPGKPSLGQMIRRLLNLVPDLKRVRLSSIDVAEIDEDLLELMKYEKRLMPHFHISLQSGDDMILKRMKRRHNRQQVIEFCQEIRKYREDVAYGADIIVGFPTETEEMFENTVKLVTEADLQFLHVFPYSMREGTPAARMPQLDKETKKKRGFTLREVGRIQLEKFFANQLGKKMKVIIENNGIGRAENYVKIDIGQTLESGKIVEVYAKSWQNDCLIGEVPANN